MRAIILTSETEQLRPLSERIPSAMLPVLSRPVMLSAIEQLAQQGIRDVVVSLSHLPGSVEAYFGSGQRWNLSLAYILQREPWGTAGALKWAENLLPETFLVLPADQIFDLDMQALLTFHQEHQSQATVVVHPQGAGTKFGFDSAGNLGMADGASETFAATGIYLFEPSVFEAIPPRTVWEISSDLIPYLMRQGVRVSGYRLPAFWHGINTFSDYQTAHWTYLEHLETSHEAVQGPVRPDILLRARPVTRGIWVGRNTLIHPAARLTPPVFIGENSFVGRDVELGPEAMLGSNVLVDDGATIANSTVLDHTYVGQWVNVRHSIASPGLLIDVATGESLPIVDEFLLGEIRSFSSESIFHLLPDMLIALALLVGLSPFLLVFSIMAFLSTGKMFVRTLYLGMETSQNARDGRPNALKNIQLVNFSTQRADGKPTRIGQWLTRWEFQRLPELWNVLRGDLRLIGVKSLSPDDASKINETWQQKRNEYASGFSGLWYTQTSPDCSLDEILITDAYYVATRNWREDVRILWKTPATWWQHVSKSD